MKTLEDERYVIIRAYKCTVSEIRRDFFVLAYSYCVYVHYNTASNGKEYFHHCTANELYAAQDELSKAPEYLSRSCAIFQKRMQAVGRL